MSDDRGLIIPVEAPKAVVDEFRSGFHAQMALAAVRQEKINALNRQSEIRTLEGTGQLVAQVDADVYWAMRARFGPMCWREPGFLESCFKKGTIERPRVRQSGTLRLQGLRDTETGRRGDAGRLSQ